ncbi:regulatory protein [Kineothrix alysoides]|uniref:Regulatory protein RecX n=1 Tax=Kineothrix alysoides TaxID=1469948 RepID=A0A4R1QZH1_9FIRM|nr:regulatory protein RecX [Kineothrix alysoides]TCL58403.1 regulatory protein [Kineothrix alysoides]
MIVTKIEELDKKRVRVYIDDEFAFVIYKGELRLYGLKEMKEVDGKAYGDLMSEVLPKRAKLRCMNLLKSKSYTERQLRDKLRQGEYTQELIEIALEYVKSYGYVDDERYCEDFIEYQMEKKSRKRMEQDLLNKGIDKNVIFEVFERMKEGGNEPDEFSMAAKFLQKKKYDVNTATIEEKRRLAAFLYRKGFGADTIRRVLLLDITPI